MILSVVKRYQIVKQPLSIPSLLSAFSLKAPLLKTVVLGALLGSMTISGLTACGQKGSLYLPQDADRRSDYIIYKTDEAHRPPKTNAIKPAEAVQTNTEINSVDNDAILSNPNDY